MFGTSDFFFAWSWMTVSVLNRARLGFSSFTAASRHGCEVGAICAVLHHERPHCPSRPDDGMLAERHPLSAAHGCTQSTDILRHDGGHICQKLMRTLSCGSNGDGCRVETHPEKSFEVRLAFSRPWKSWKMTTVLESWGNCCELFWKLRDYKIYCSQLFKD